MSIDIASDYTALLRLLQAAFISYLTKKMLLPDFAGRSMFSKLTDGLQFNTRTLISACNLHNIFDSDAAVIIQIKERIECRIAFAGVPSV